MIQYKNFTIVPDKMLGYSLIDRNECWAMSGSLQDCKDSVDKIIEADIET